MARLVICDDETHITDILARFFREKGHEVFGSTRAEEAVAHVLDRSVDLVITDIAMKGLSGFDLLRRIKAAGTDVPVIITTGNPSHNTAVQALREGAFDYVVKPFHLEEILERAERALAMRRIREENLLYSKLVSLHSISRILSEAADLADLSAKVVQMGSRLTRSDAGWYWTAPAGASTDLASTAAISPEPGSLDLHSLLLRVARATLDKGDVMVTDPAGEPGGDGSLFLSLPVMVGSAIHGVLIFRRAGEAGRWDAVDLEVFSQLGSTFALSIRALGPLARPQSAPGRSPAPASPLPAAPTVAWPDAPPSAGEAAPASVATTMEGKTIESWARLVGRMVDEHCAGYQSKVERVAAVGRALLRELRWPEAEGDEWEVISRVYDLPKLRVPQRVLAKPKALTDKEREFLLAQASWARELLASVPGLGVAARVVEDFQERFDGSGRPRGAKGHAIAPLARLLAVADAFIALQSERPYRPAYAEAQAIELVRAESGRRFDPEVVLALSRFRGA